MKKIDLVFKNELDKELFVRACESDFESRLDEISKKVINSGKSTILLSGPTCAGKTTSANKIIEDFSNTGKNVIVISLDDFFKERDDQRQIKENEKIDYDSVDVIDLPLLSECIKQIKIGNIINVPIFDFVSQKRNGCNTYTINENDILIFEGIQAVYPEITSLFDTEYIGVFIDVSEDVCINNVHFTKNEIRLIRRLVRDEKFRGATPEFTFFLWESVRENEEKSIFPNKNICKIQIDTFMGYEPFLMKGYLIDILSEITENSKYYERAKELINKVSRLEEIDYKYIPKNSLYTEFLGKK